MSLEHRDAQPDELREGPAEASGGRCADVRGRPRLLRDVGFAMLALVAVAIAVSAVVFGLILILYDPSATLHAVA